MKGNSDRTISLAADDRARVPFAMIGVLLLVTSSGMVTYLETRPEPEPGVDTQLAMDRASASAQTAVSEGVSEAADEAATEPLTTTANTPVGRAIADTDTVIDGDEEKYDVFGPYVRLRIYLEAKRNLEESEQRIDDDTVARASLPDVEYTEEGVEEAIDRVDLTVGRYDSGLETGTVQATIDGVEVEVVQNGETIAQREESVTVTTGTTVFELHERTATYEDRLQMDFYDSELTNIEGFGQRFGARVYPLVWGKAYTERMHPKSKPVPHANSGTKFAFHSAIENYETEALANSAIYAIQEDVYGAKDPQSTGPMRGAYACMAAKTGEKIANGKKKSSSSSDKSGKEASESSSSVSGSGDTKTYTNSTGASFQLNAKQFCAATNYLFGDVEGDSPTSVQEIVEGQVGGAQSPMENEDTIPIELFAEPAYQEVTGGEMPEPKDMNTDIEKAEKEEAEDTASEAVDKADAEDEYEANEYDFDSDDLAESYVEDAYSVDASASRSSVSKTGGRLPDAEEPEDHSGWSQTSSSYDVTNRDTTIEHTELPGGSDSETLHEITIEITNEYVEEADWERTEEECEVVTPGPNETGNATEECYEVTITESTSSESKELGFETTIIVEGHYDPAMLADEKSVANVYNDDGAPKSTSNLEPALDMSVERLVNVDAGSVEEDLESDLDQESITSSGDLRRQVDDQIDDETTISSGDIFEDEAEKEAVVTWVGDELWEEHTDVQGTSTDVKRKELIVGDNPLEPLRDEVDKKVDVEGGTGPYDTPAHVARANLVKEYRDGVHEWMDKYIEKRNDGHEQVSSDQLEDAGGDADEGIDSTLGFAQRSMTYNFGDNTADVDGSELHENVTFEVDASPTYLSRNPVTRATVNDVRPSYAGPESPQDADHAPLALRNQAWLPTPGLPLVPWPAYWYGSINNWDVDVKGEYARFEVTANTSGASNTRSTTYVRQEQPVTLEINDQDRTVGKVDPIGFESETNVVVVTPGFTLYPRGSWGPGDRFHTRSKHRLSECSKTWDHAGTDFSPTKVNYADCPNVKNSSSVTFGSTELSADGDGEIEAEHDGVEIGVSGNGLDVDSEDDVEDGPAVDECDEESLTERLDDDAEDWYGRLSDTEQTKVWWRHYCQLPTAGHDYRTEYVEFLNHDEAGGDWQDVVVDDRIGYTDVLTTLHDVTVPAEAHSRSLEEKHEITDFRTATEQNNREPPESSHREPGIVTTLETDERDSFARIYDVDSDYGPSGSWLARQEAFTGEDRRAIVDKLALWDDEVVQDESESWGNYQCFAKVYVPPEMELTVSRAGGFSHDSTRDTLDGPALDSHYGGRLDGGAKQVQVVPNPGDDDWDFDDDDWVPLGTVDNGGLESKMATAERGDDLSGETCPDI